MKKIKIVCLFVLVGIGISGAFLNKGFVNKTSSFSSGPPAGFSGAPDENNCAACHSGSAPNGQFTILDAPATYNPGQTYPLRVVHTNTDTTRTRWGFEMTSLAGGNAAGTFANPTANTQTISGNGRFYVEHTSAGTYAGQSGGAQWTVNWTAPSTNIGPVNLYAAGNQANNDGGTGGDQIYTTNVAIRPPSATAFDFDGDRKTDLGIFRPGPGEWWINRSSNGGTFVTTFGVATDRIAAADFTGDGRADVAFWRPLSGQWFILRSEDSSFFAFPFGANGDVPVPADYDGDGRADAAVFRPSSNTWFISRSSGGTTITGFGIAGDVPVTADYDGDGKSDIAIYRPNAVGGAQWWIQRSSNLAVFVTQFGTSTDRTVPGDYTGDGKADIAFWRPSTGFWNILRSEDFSFFAFPFGTNGDVPSPGDYDGDGRFDAAVFRPSNSTWFASRSSSTVLIQQFGITGDLSLPNALVR